MRRFNALVALFVLVISHLAWNAAADDSAALEGTFTMVSGTADGFAMPDAMAKTGKRVAKDGETTVTMNGQLYFKAKYTLDLTKTPKAIDYAMIEGPTKGKTQLGIYEIEGETVKFCFAAPGADRPADFTSVAGSGRTLSVWKKDK